MSGSGELQRKGVLERAFGSILSSLSSSVYVASHDAALSTPVWVALTLIQYLQFLYFPVALMLGGGQTTQILTLVLKVTSLTRIDEEIGPLGFIVVTGIIFAINFSFAFTMQLTSYFTFHNKPVPGVLASVNRLMQVVAPTVLFLPLQSVMLRAATCIQGNTAFGLPCYEGVHIAIGALAIGFWTTTLGIAIGMVATFLDRNPLSRSLGARSHGRVEAALLFSKSILCVMFNSFEQSGTNWFSVIVLVAVVAAWIMGYLRLAPMIHPAVNDVMVAAGVSLGWVMLGVALQRVVTNQDLTSMILIGVPLSFVFAVYLARYSRITLCRQSLQDLDSLYDVDLWARSRLQLFQKLQLDVEEGSRVRDRWSMRESGSQAGAKAALKGTGLASNVARSIGVSGATGTRGAAVHLASQVIIRLGSSYAEDERMTTVLAAEVELAYQTMMDKFPSSSLAHLLAATYFRLAHPSRYMELHALNLARKSNAPLDVSFFIYQRTRDLIDMDTSYLPSGELRSGVAGTKAITPVDRTAYEGRLLGAFNAQTACYRALLRVWDALQEPVPDLAELQRMGELLWSNLDDAERHFKVLLTMNPEGVSVLRAYAAFQRTLMHNATTAYELEGRADALADAAARTAESLVSRFTLMGPAPDLGFMEEGVAMITISTEVSRVGEILSVNSAACRLLLRNRSDLVGSNISVIMPKPISTVHDQFLLRYTRTGSAKLVGSTHQVLVQQSNGYIQPCRMHMQEAAPTMSDTSPRLAAVLQPMRVAENVILFGSEDEEFQIFSADAASHELMGTDPELLEDMGASVITYFPAVHPGYVNLDELDFDEAQGSARSRSTSGSGAYHGPAGASVGVSHGINNHSLLHATTFVKTPVRVDEGGLGMDDFGALDGGGGEFGDFDDDSNHLQVLGFVQTMSMPTLGGSVYVLQWRRTDEDLAAEAAALEEAERELREGTIRPSALEAVGPPPLTLELVSAGEKPLPSTPLVRPSKESKQVASPAEGSDAPVVAEVPAAGQGRAQAESQQQHQRDQKKSAHAAMIRKVIDAQRLVTDLAIMRMRYILYALFAIVPVIAVALMAQQLVATGVGRLHTSSLYDGGRRAILSRQTLLEVKALQLQAQGHSPLNRPDRTFQNHSTLLTGLTLELDSVKERLSADIQILGGEQLAYETTRSIPRVASGGASSVMNPAEATESLLSGLHVLRFASADEIAPNGSSLPILLEVLSNQPAQAAAFDESMEHKFADLIEYFNGLEVLTILFVAAIFVVVFIAVAIAFFVLVKRLAQDRLSALSVFLDVPTAAAGRMRDLTADMLSAHLRRVADEMIGDVDYTAQGGNGSEHGDSDSDGEGEEEEGRLAPSSQALGVEADWHKKQSKSTSQVLSPVSVEDGTGEPDWDQLFAVEKKKKHLRRSGGLAGTDAVARADAKPRVGAQRRTGSDSANWMQWTIAKVQAPVASLIVWLGVYYVLETTTLQDVQQDVQRLYLAQSSQGIQLDMQIAVGTLFSEATSSRRVQTERSLVELQGSAFRSLQAMVSGTEFVPLDLGEGVDTLHPLDSTGFAFSLLLLDGCLRSPQPGCPDFANGTVTRGALPATHSLLSSIRRVLAFIPSENASLTASDIVSISPAVTALHSIAGFEEPHLRWAYDALSVSFQDKAEMRLATTSTAELVITICFVILFLLVVAPAYLQLVTSLGRTVKASRILLTAFSEPLVSRMPSVQSELQAIVNRFTSSTLKSSTESGTASWRGRSG